MAVRVGPRKTGQTVTEEPENHPSYWEETPQNMERLKEVMTLREASQYLGITPDTLYKYLGERSIPAFKLGNRWRFKKDLLDRWMERKSEATELANDRKRRRLVKTLVKAD